MAPAHPHATGVAVYPALLKSLMIREQLHCKTDFYQICGKSGVPHIHGYMATLVAEGWAGAVMKLLIRNLRWSFDTCVKTARNHNEAVLPKDRLTNRRTDRQSYNADPMKSRVRSLKIVFKYDSTNI